jgi:hypothetical protein
MFADNGKGFLATKFVSPGNAESGNLYTKNDGKRPGSPFGDPCICCGCCQPILSAVAYSAGWPTPYKATDIWRLGQNDYQVKFRLEGETVNLRRNVKHRFFFLRFQISLASRFRPSPTQAKHCWTGPALQKMQRDESGGSGGQGFMSIDLITSASQSHVAPGARTTFAGRHGSHS